MKINCVLHVYYIFCIIYLFSDTKPAVMIVYQGKRVVLPNGYLGPAAVVVQNGKIEKIYKKYPFTPGTTLFKVRHINGVMLSTCILT